MSAASAALRQLGLTVVERGWLSSNCIFFEERDGDPATVVDSGYDSHQAHTVALVGAQLRGGPLARVLNTHLHSDHCGGNRALQERWGSAVWVPEPSFDTVERWDESALTFATTGQTCRRFTAAGMLSVGATIALAGRRWQVHPAPGHDPNAVMLFQPESRVLISGDALWQERLAIIFPELVGDHGFSATRIALGAIAELDPLVVIPGHGAPFTDVAAALAKSGRRLSEFEADPPRHRAYAERALAMFHMLEVRRLGFCRLTHWLRQAPILNRGAAISAEHADNVVNRLVRDGQLQRDSGDVVIAAR